MNIVASFLSMRQSVRRIEAAYGPDVVRISAWEGSRPQPRRGLEVVQLVRRRAEAVQPLGG